jgi:phytanoyl-CoA hydroxylase
MPVTLTSEQVDQYYKEGFIIVRGALSDEDFAPIESAYSDLLDARIRTLVSAGKLSDPAEGEGFATRLARVVEQIPVEDTDTIKALTANLDLMIARLPAVFGFFFNPNLLAPVESIIGSEITLSPIQHIRPYIPIRGDSQPGQVPWHQDQGVTKEEADASEIMTVWIPMVDVDPSSGCLQILPGITSHGLLQHEPEGGTRIKPDLMPEADPYDCIMSRGDLLFMSAYTPHRGQPNRSDYVRWTMDLRFQKTGTPTGRPVHPEFILRSKQNPSSVQDDYDEWCRRWIEGREAGKGVRHHRV